MQTRPIPSVSVVMPAYNAAKYIAEAIDSILAQTYTDFEFIIINDGSVDDTEKIIQSYDDPRIVYLKNEVNSGICVTLNKGLDAARGRYIARMDADDISLPQRFEKQVMFMDNHSEIGVVGSDIEAFSSNSGGSNVINFDIDPQICKANLIFSASLAHPAALIRASVINDNNIRYEDYYRGMEDHHLWWRISKYSGISNISEVLLRYRQHVSQVTKQTTNEEFKIRLRTFIRQRVYSCGAILDSDEMNAFYLYHESNSSYDKDSLKYFIFACHKILQGLKKKKVKYYVAQKKVFSRAISYCLDKSGFNALSNIRYHVLALSNNTMNSLWFLKRISHLLSKIRKPAKRESYNDLNVKYNTKKRIAILMYYMNCGGVESALVNLLSKKDFDDFSVDLYLIESKGEFLNRLNRQVNIIDLSAIFHPVQKKLIISQSIHETIRYALKNGYYFRVIKHSFIYAWLKFRKCEFPAYKAALLSKRIADFKYDLILDFHGYASFTTYFGAYVLSGKRKLTWCHSQNINFENAVKCVNQYDRMFTVSSEMTQSPSLRKINIPVEVFYNFIDAGKILEQAYLGDGLNKSPNCMSLLTIGRLSQPKGYDIAIETAKVLRDQGLDFKWYFCGDGEERNMLINLVKTYKLEEHIIFMGFQSNPYGYLLSCDIYVQPSKWEGYAVTLMEAKVLHKVIVTTKVSGAKEAVQHGFDGYICRQDPLELAEKLRTLLTDRRLLESMRNNAMNTGLIQDSSELKLKSILDSI